MSTVLFVCTGNQCRSPMSVAMLRHLRPELTVVSAGLVAGGVAASAGSLEAMASRGLALDDHVSRQLERTMIDEADLVLGLARHHLREIVVLAPDALPRTFTLKELVRRGTIVGPRHPAEPMDEWLEKVGGGRRTVELLAEDRADDVEDPMGRSQKAYEACATELTDLIARLASLAFPEA